MTVVACRRKEVVPELVKLPPACSAWRSWRWTRDLNIYQTPSQERRDAGLPFTHEGDFCRAPLLYWWLCCLDQALGQPQLIFITHPAFPTDDSGKLCLVDGSETAVRKRKTFFPTFGTLFVSLLMCSSCLFPSWLGALP